VSNNGHPLGRQRAHQDSGPFPHLRAALTDSRPTLGAKARLCRTLRLAAVALLLVASGCTTAALRPRPTGVPDVYTFRIAFNLLATPSAVEEAAQREMEAFRIEKGYAKYAVVSGYCLQYSARYCDYLVRFHR
jgi:hypothetical protein